MAAIDANPGLLSDFEQSNTFITDSATTKIIIGDEREFFMNNLRRELKPEDAPDFADVIGSGAGSTNETGTPLADLADLSTPVDMFENITVETVKGKRGRMYRTFSDGKQSLTVVQFQTVRGALVCVCDNLMPYEEFLRIGYISTNADGVMVACADPHTYEFRNTTMPLLVTALQVCGGTAFTGEEA